MSAEYVVRTIREEEIDLILPLAMKSWKFTYQDIFSNEFIENHVSRAYRKENLKKIMGQSVNGLTTFYVLVEVKTNLVRGYAQIGYDRFWETGEKRLPLRLFRIYLDPEILGKGLGKLLLDQVEQFVRKTGMESYIVGVHEKNTIGLRFYKKSGFNPLTLKTDAEGEIYFIKNLS